MRSFDFEKVAQNAYNSLDETNKKFLQAYCDGINDYVKNLIIYPSEFLILNIGFSQWSIMDTLTIGMFTSFQLSPYWASTLLRSTIAKNHGKELAKNIASYGEKSNIFTNLYTIVSEEQIKKFGIYEKNTTKTKEIHKNVTENIKINTSGIGVVDGGGSNSWVISGKYTKSGKPIISGDPHVGSTQPGIFYSASLKLSKNTVTGFTIAGIPLILFGRTNYVAWAVTSSYIENMDLYTLKLDFQTEKYFHDNQWKPLKIKENNIKVRNHETIKYKTYATHHGAVLVGPPKEFSSGLPEPYFRWEI